MTPRETLLERLGAYVDHQMSPDEARAFQRLLDSDPALLEAAEKLRRQNRDLQTAFEAPAAERLDHLLDAARRGHRPPAATLRNLAAALALVATGLGAGFWIGQTRATAALLAQTDEAASFVASAMAAHALFSPEVLHPVEVTAGEKDHLIGWLSNRLGAPVTAPDLTSDGYHLIGGRLLPFGARPAAQFMYEDAEGHRLTFFASLSDRSAQTPMGITTQGGLSSVTWHDRNWNFTAVGTLDRDALARIARRMQGQLI